MLLEARAPISSPINEVFIYSFPQDISPLVGEVEHVVLLLLSPVIPPVLLDMPVVFLTENISSLSGNNSDPILVDPHVMIHAIGMIDFINLVIDPVQLPYLVGVGLRLWAVVWVPSQLGGI